MPVKVLLPRDAMLARYMLSSCVRLSLYLSVRPSICLSVTSRPCTKRAKCSITQATPYYSPGNLVFWRETYRRNSDGVTHNWSAKYRWSRFKSVIFDQYLAISQKRCKR